MQRRVFVASTNGPMKRRTQLRVSKDTTFNYDDFKNDIAILRKNANVSIMEKDRNTEVAEALLRVRSTLQTMSGDKSYEELNTIVESAFNDITTPIPYTIGAHFRGWNIETNMDDTDFGPCVAVRIGSLQKPGFVNKCKYVSMYASWSNDKFSFSDDIDDRSTDKRKLSQVVINIPFTNVNNFPGFSAEEKEELKRNDITHVCIMGFRMGSNNYTHLTKGEFIPLENVKTRHSSNSTRKIPIKQPDRAMTLTKEQYNNDSYGAAAWIFFILIIIVILFLFYFFWK